MNQVIIWMTKRNSQLEDLCSQHGLSTDTSVQPKARFTPHLPPRLPVPPTAVLRVRKVWLENSCKTKMATMIEKVDKVTLNQVILYCNIFLLENSMQNYRYHMTCNSVHLFPPGDFESISGEEEVRSSGGETAWRVTAVDEQRRLQPERV